LNGLAAAKLSSARDVRLLGVVLSMLLTLVMALPATAHRAQGVSARASGTGYVTEGRYSDVFQDFLTLRNRNPFRVTVRCTVNAWSDWLDSAGTSVERYQATKTVRVGIPRARFGPAFKTQDFVVLIPHPEKWDHELGIVPFYDQVGEGVSVPHCH
jgi:hypothetical protein